MRRDEVALLVEDGVVRQELLAVHAVDAAVRADRSRVVEVAARFGETDHGRGPGRARRDLVEHLDRLRDERGPQQQIFGRVARDRELREHDEVATGRFGARRTPRE